MSVLDLQPAIPCAVGVDADLLCGGCGQNLRCVTADRCPECGRRFDRAHLISAHIPWERRKYLGRLRAFGRTVVAVSFHPWRLIDPHDNPITLRAARAFRARTVLLLFVPMFLVTFSWYTQQARMRRPTATFGSALYKVTWWQFGELLLTPWFFYTSAVAVLLGLFAVTGMASLFFAPRRLSPFDRQRGVAASLYANALLVWLVPLLGFASLGRTIVWWVDRYNLHGEWLAIAFEYVTGTIALASLLAWWLIPCRLLYGITRSWPRVVAFAVAWPALCVAATLGIFVGLHLLVTYAVLLMGTF